MEVCVTIISASVLSFGTLSAYFEKYPLWGTLIMSAILYLIGYSEFKEGRGGFFWSGLGIYVLIAFCGGSIFLRKWLDALIGAVVAGYEVWHWSRRNGGRKPAG
jgi:hypothetical protein